MKPGICFCYDGFVMKDIMIYFDIDDTLYDVSGPFKAAFRQLYPEKRDVSADELFVRFRKHCDDLFFEAEKGIISQREMYIYRTKRTLAEIGIDADDDEALEFQKTYQNRQMMIELPEYMEKILDALKKKDIRMGIISNGPAGHQWDKVRSLSLLRWIDEKDVVISGEAGVAKPDLRIFAIAAERSGLDADHLWYVGDSFGNDIVPAVLCGWHTVWYDHRHKEKDSDIVPERIAGDPGELADILISI